MTKTMTLIKNWEELSKIPANDKYRIVVDKNMCSGWIVPVKDLPGEGTDDFVCNCEEMTAEEYCKEHIYLSTHTFYGSQYEYSTMILQEHGFDVELDNWDKGE